MSFCEKGLCMFNQVFARWNRRATAPEMSLMWYRKGSATHNLMTASHCLRSSLQTDACGVVFLFSSMFVKNGYYVQQSSATARETATWTMKCSTRKMRIWHFRYISPVSACFQRSTKRFRFVYLILRFIKGPVQGKNNCEGRRGGGQRIIPSAPARKAGSFSASKQEKIKGGLFYLT